MLRPRITPCLLIQDGGLVKTKKFKNPKYIGDPINAVKIFNEKESDELIVLDIDASVHGDEPNFQTIKNLANECRMPLCYGGGVKTVEHVKKIISLGAEKVAISSAAIENPDLIKEASNVVGSQSIVVVLDIKKKFFTNKYEICTHNGNKSSPVNLITLIQRLESLGAGEIVLNSIDNDGCMKGYDIDLVKQVKEKVSIPITVLGGCGSLKDMEDLFSTFGTIGAAAGSLFVFKGRYNAVLINYPKLEDKERMIKLTNISI